MFRSRTAPVPRMIAAGLLIATILGPLAPIARGQAPGTPIEENLSDDAYLTILPKASALREAGRLIDAAAVRRALARPQPEAFALPPRRTAPLPRTELARRARAALVRLGWLYRDEPDGEWQIDLAGGYRLAAGGVVGTCRHVVDPDYPEPLSEGYLFAVDDAGVVYPVTAILAADDELDAAIVKVAGLPGEPLPLNDRSAPGDACFCYSDPMGVWGYFCEGIVNRFYWFDVEREKDPTTLAGARNLRMHVSNDWAPGSSGSPVLDECGNVLGHVSEIESLLDDASDDGWEEQRAAVTDESSAQETASNAAAPVDAANENEASNDNDAPSASTDDAGEAFSWLRDAALNLLDEPDPYADAPATLMVLHTAVPARGVRLLAEACRQPATAPHAAAATR